MNLEELGFTKEELQNRVVDQICDQLLTSKSFDEDGDETEMQSTLHRKLNEIIKKRVDEKIEELGAKHVLPRVSEMVENITIQKTNGWGEAKEAPISFIEYLIRRAEAYMVEKVDHNGRGKGEGDSYNWSGSNTRVAYLFEKHLQYNIEEAMKKSLSEINSTIAKGLYEACRLKINEAAQGFTIAFKQPR